MKSKTLATAVPALAFAAALAVKAFASPLAVWSAVDWSEVDQEIDAKNTNENLDVSAGRGIELPAGTLNKLAGKKMTLALHTGDGIAVSISGRELKAADYDRKITLMDEEDAVPEGAADHILEGALYYRMVAMAEKEEYGIPLNIHFCLPRETARKYANLYYYDELTEDMVFMTSYKVTDTGMAMFPLTRGDEYVLTVTEALPSGAKIGYLVKSGDCLSKIAARYGVSLKSVLKANPWIKDADKIHAGDVVTVVKP